MKKIGMILLILVILVFNFIVGANEKGLRILPISILMMLTLVYLLTKKIKEPDKSIFFKSKIDYLVLIFMFTTTLPFVFGTYCSYSYTVEFIMKYFFIYSVYLLARNVITEKKDINYLITATLSCSLIPLILGLDYVNGKYLDWVVDGLNLTYVDFPSFCATFGYSNTVAIYMSLCMFLAIYKIKNSESKIAKIIIGIYILFISYSIWIAESKSVVAILLITLLIYFAIENRKKIHDNFKKVLIVFSLILIIGIPLTILVTSTSKPFLIKEQYFVKRIQYDFEANKLYKLELDIDAYINEVQVKDIAFELQIIQANKYFFESKIAKMRFGNINGRIAIEFTPEEGYSYINIRILNDFYGKINVKKCYINGEEYILKYKYVPIQIGQIFSHYRFNQKTLKERGYIYSDCIEIAKENLIIGQGGNTWKVLSSAVEQYKALIKETHSYFFELLISYGIIGVLAFLTLVVSLFIKIFKQMKKNKEKRKDKVLIFIGVFFVLIHSIVFDFNMSFMLIQLMVYIYMGALLYDEQNNEKIPKAIDYIFIIFLAFILSIYIRADMAKYFVDDIYTKQSILGYSSEYRYEKIIKEVKEEKNQVIILKDIQELINKDPYYEQTKVYKVYLEQICNNIEKLSNEEIKEYADFIINKLKTVKFKTPLFLDTILTRTSIIKNAINKLKEYESKLEEDSETKKVINNAINGLEEILDNEYEKNIYNIETVEKTGYSKNEADMIKKQYLNILGKD